MRQNNSWLRDRVGRPQPAWQAGVLMPNCITSELFSILGDNKGISPGRPKV